MRHITPSLFCKVLLVAGSVAALGCGPRQEDAADALAEVPREPVKAPVQAGTMVAVSGKAPASPGGGVTIVLLESHAPIDTSTQETVPVLDQASLAFFPSVLVVRTGQPVSFQNHDSELHNINVSEDATKEQAFNIALPNGGVYHHTFARDGFYSVHCDIHPAMSANVMATSSPYAVIADADGRFAFPHVAPGAYTATVYAGGQRTQEEIAISGSRDDLVLGARP
jgi:plastocyanin